MTINKINSIHYHFHSEILNNFSIFSNWEGVKNWECFLSLAQPKFYYRNISMLVQLKRHLDSKGKQKNQLKIYKNEMMIMREKHMRKKIGNMRKWSNFVKKKWWWWDQNKWIWKLRMKRKTHQFEQRALHLKIENNRNNVLFLFLEKIKRKTPKD